MIKRNGFWKIVETSLWNRRKRKIFLFRDFEITEIFRIDVRNWRIFSSRDLFFFFLFYWRIKFNAVKAITGF